MTTRPTITDLYAESASPDSIRAEIKKAHRTQAQWTRHADNLCELLGTRLAQIEAGAWPATAEPTR